MTVQMTIMGRTIGTLEIQCTTDNAYQPEHITALQMAANLAANTIENVQTTKSRTKNMKTSSDKRKRWKRLATLPAESRMTLTTS